MPICRLILDRYRARRRYLETCRVLRDLDVDARNDIGVIWLDIDDVARRASLRADG